MLSTEDINNSQPPTNTTVNSANSVHTPNATHTANNGIKFSQKSLNLRSVRRVLPKLYDAIKSNQNWGFFRLWWHLGSISEGKIAAALDKLSSDQKLIALKEIAENISNAPQSIRDDLVKFTQNYILYNLQEFLDYNGDPEQKEDIVKSRDALVNIFNKLPYNKIFQTYLEALLLVIVKIQNELDGDEKDFPKAKFRIYEQAFRLFGGSEYFSVIEDVFNKETDDFKKSVIDFFVEKYRSQGEATILENAWKFPPSDLQAKMIAACINYQLFDRASSAKNITLLVNNVGERKTPDGEPIIARVTYTDLAKGQTLDSFQNAVNNPALFDKGQQNHGQSFREFYSLLRTTQFFKDVIDRANIKEISLGKYTWRWQKDSTNEQRTEDLLDTILKFCSNGNENPTPEEYKKAGKFAEKFFLNQNCSANNSTISYTAFATIDTTIEKNMALYFLAFNNIINVSEARKILLTVTENNELISTEYYYFDKNDSSLQEVLQENFGYQQLLKQYSESFSPDEYPNANGSFMIFCRTTKIDLNQENPEEIDINNDENSSIFLTLGTP